MKKKKSQADKLRCNFIRSLLLVCFHLLLAPCVTVKFIHSNSAKPLP